MPEQNPVQRLYEIATFYTLSRCLHVAANLGVADALASEPRKIADVATDLNANADALARILRLLAAYGVFKLDGGLISHTPTSQVLSSNHPQSIRNLVRLVGDNDDWQVYEQLAYTVENGKAAAEIVHATKAWSENVANPEADAIFNAAMTEYSRDMIPGIAGAFDYRPYPVIGDIGGGVGHVLRAVLDKAPDSTGILYDLPHVIESARSQRSDRITLVGGDIFSDAIPACDLYLIKDVLHDWPDAESIQILRNVRASAHPGSKLLLIETIISEGNELDPAKELDIRMMIMFGARQRTAAEFASLLSQSGFELQGVIDTGASISLVEANPV